MKKSKNTTLQRRQLIIQRETIALLTPLQLSKAVGGSDESYQLEQSCSPTDYWGQCQSKGII